MDIGYINEGVGPEKPPWDNKLKYEETHKSIREGGEMGIAPLVAYERRVGEQMLDSLPGCASTEIRQIARLKDYAIDAPESRKAVVKTLERYMLKKRGTKEGRAAQTAISLIITVSMLEVLQG